MKKNLYAISFSLLIFSVWGAFSYDNGRISNKEFNDGIGYIVYFTFFLLVVINIPSNKNLKTQQKEETPIIKENIGINSMYEKNANCPYCKNPNTKKSNECEWCGSKI